MQFRYAKESHPVFAHPADANVKLWRYVDLAKLISLLKEEAMFFCRVDRFTDDPFEGSSTRLNQLFSRQVWREVPEPHLSQFLAMQTKGALHMRACTAINCWHENEHESAAMWRLYLSANEGIALQTTFARLVGAFPDSSVGPDTTTIFVGRVQYIDYETAAIPEGNAFWPFVHKRTSFAHEREVRCVIQELGKGPGAAVDLPPGIPEPGLLVPVDLDLLIESIYVSPTSPAWFTGVVEAVVQKFGRRIPVRQSNLRNGPVF